MAATYKRKRRREQPIRRPDRGGPREPHEARPQRDRPGPVQPADHNGGEAAAGAGTEISSLFHSGGQNLYS